MAAHAKALLLQGYDPYSAMGPEEQHHSLLYPPGNEDPLNLSVASHPRTRGYRRGESVTSPSTSDASDSTSAGLSLLNSSKTADYCSRGTVSRHFMILSLA
ncbi:hypothetical protein AVEN_151490-1 [Araneus ventricosus]|uniref:Uncharacterized protein n=1 Tax=Araneus ventricosus TaxID=182803 RepID=A0A4Y2HYN1_ARAVE|nr:hypothetical protein AVEN_151490-1 [Araneus ventricosus]